MDFYCITRDDNRTVRDFLIKACADRGVNYVEINPKHSKLDILEYPFPKKGDALYRVAANDINAKKVEYEMAGEGVATFYSSRDNIFRPSTALKLKGVYGVSIPETVSVLTNSRRILKKYAEHLGLPLIIKSMGGSGGVGVVRVDSLQSLFSVADLLYKQGANCVLRKFIDNTETLRLIVLGDEVLASIKYMASNDDDFRSNRRTGLDKALAIDCDEATKKMAIKAVQAMGLEFAGVDVIVDKEGNPYVLEANCPCNFGDVQTVTGIDIAGKMIDYLLKKSRR